MISVAKNELSVLQFTNLSQFSDLLHFSSTRIGGFSADNYRSLNLGFNSGDHAVAVTENRIKLCNSLEIDPECMVFPKQTHTATIKTITTNFFELRQEDRKHFLNETDAVITNLKGVCVAIKTADCVPVLLFDHKRKAIAAIHAGWRGTVQNIVLKTIQKMAAEFGTVPSDLYAGICPSISPEVYEVGEEVWKQFDASFYSETNPFKTGKRLLDLWRSNFQQMIMAGIPENQVEIAQTCTFSDPDRFFSARRDGLKTGRMATGIMLR